MSKKVLLYGDTDLIKEYVFETSSLPQIRGGSSLLIDCEKEVKNLIKGKGGKEIYCAGGSFLFQIPEEQTASLVAKIERIYFNKTLAATVTVVIEDTTLTSTVEAIPENGWAACLANEFSKSKSDFARRMAFLSAHLQEAKRGKGIAPFMEAFPFGKRCETCGKRMAAHEVCRHEPEDDQRVEIMALCPVCLKRHEAGVINRRQKKKAKGKFNEEFYEKLVAKKVPLNASQSPDLDHLVKSARRKYLAFLYVDGNNIGSLLQKVNSEQEYQALSRALSEGTKEALFQAFVDTCRKALREEEYWPFEIINVGGDDVTLVLQAGYAWEMAVKFLVKFEGEIKQRIISALGYWPDEWPPKITASCGIAIADVKYPIRYLERLAEGLLKEAKKLAKKKLESPTSTINFLWLPNPVVCEDITSLMDYYHRDELRLTARPYTLSQAKKIMDMIEQASQWPRTRRHHWGEALEKGVYVSLNTIFYDIARKSKAEQRERLFQFLNETKNLFENNQNILSAPWVLIREHSKEKYCTPLLDILELSELRAGRQGVNEEMGRDE
jgi:hypothetical protein